ncbi:MAG TPA: anti-sigma regulatory factor [Bryobacteraceae bacterium]|nr:anti-sigma regulatory factor [Bryobacteraceae bacterium]
MTVEKQTELPLKAQEDVVSARQLVRSWAVELGLNLVDQTKIITAASELARNAVIYGGGGLVRLEILLDTGKRGMRLTFEDRGPGILDIERAMSDGYTTGNGLGLGLGGAKRLSHEFFIESKPGAGTRISIVRWKS